MSRMRLSDFQETVLAEVAGDDVDIYDLTQSVGADPTDVQQALQHLARHGLVDVEGRLVRCTSRGERALGDG